jgi:hypothetical protein
VQQHSDVGAQLVSHEIIGGSARVAGELAFLNVRCMASNRDFEKKVFEIQ